MRYTKSDTVTISREDAELLLGDKGWHPHLQYAKETLRRALASPNDDWVKVDGTLYYGDEVRGFIQSDAHSPINITHYRRRASLSSISKGRRKLV